MNTCDHCGAPLERDFERKATCTFCDRVNAPLQREVAVPVPVQVVHKVVHVVGSDASEAVELRCPRCRKRLVSVLAKDVELAGCGGCGGIWVDNESARRVLAAPETVFAELARRAGANARSRGPRTMTLTCPTCPAILDRVTTRGIELDVCDEHGTWFDPFELALLVDRMAGRETSPLPLGSTRTIRCMTCNGAITADRANITDQGLCCESCWRSQQSAAIAAADAATQRAGAIAVGGALLGVAAVLLGAAASSKSA